MESSQNFINQYITLAQGETVSQLPRTKSPYKAQISVRDSLKWNTSLENHKLREKKENRKYVQMSISRYDQGCNGGYKKCLSDTNEVQLILCGTVREKSQKGNQI